MSRYFPVSGVRLVIRCIGAGRYECMCARVSMLVYRLGRQQQYLRFYCVDHKSPSSDVGQPAYPSETAAIVPPTILLQLFICPARSSYSYVSDLCGEHSCADALPMVLFGFYNVRRNSDINSGRQNRFFCSNQWNPSVAQRGKEGFRVKESDNS